MFLVRDHFSCKYTSNKGRVQLVQRASSSFLAFIRQQSFNITFKTNNLLCELRLSMQCCGSQVSRLKITDRQTDRQTDYYTHGRPRASGI